MSSSLSPRARSFLEDVRFAVLATINSDGTPQQSTIWYELQGDEIVLNTKRGRLKDRNLRRDPRASVCVENDYTYVTVRGRATLESDQSIAQADMRRITTRYVGPEKAEQQMSNQYSKEERVTIRLKIERVDEYGFED